MIHRIEFPGSERHSSAEKFGELISQVMKKDKTFYFFSPDETTSNKLDEVYKVSARSWNMPQTSWDLKESGDGRIVETLSENTLFAVMVGHILANREPAMMTSYESFFTIITSQILQHLKFLKQSEAANREPYPAVNLLSTSTCWRQDHNGFSHQSPALISTLLDIPSKKVNCLFPVDDVAAEAAMEFMLSSKNVVNLTTFNKTEEPRWIDSHHAKFQFENGGASLYGFASDENPDYIFTAAGDIATREALYALEILRQDLGDSFRARFVGITALSYRAIGTTDNPLSAEQFAELFTQDNHRKIIANFHGYPEALKTILANYTAADRITAHGFLEEGSTTTPFEMLSLNHASRYDLALDVAKDQNRQDLVEKYQKILQQNSQHAKEHGIDLPEIAKKC